MGLFSKKKDKKVEKKVDAEEISVSDLAPDALTKNDEVIEEKAEKKETKKSEIYKRFKYTYKNDLNKIVKGTMETYEASDVRSILTACGYTVLQVEERSKSDIDIKFLDGTISAGQLSFLLTQLSTYLKAGIPLVDAVRILSKQATKPALKHSFLQLIYELTHGENLSHALEKQGKYFPPLLINMVKTAERTGDLPSVLDDMADYYTTMEQTKKQMISAMIYPVVVLIIANGVLVFMLTNLVPQFSAMFEANGGELPPLTKTIVGVSNFLINNGALLVILIMLAIGIFTYLYKNNSEFRKVVQTMLMHIPVIKNVIIYNEISNFTKTFASLLNHGVFITDSMQILSNITNNEVYKGIIRKTLVNLGKGETTSSAFRGEWAIPIVAYEMIVTGEQTGQLGAMMDKVAKHFQGLHKNIIDTMKSLLEPALIVFLAVVVGIILVSIIQPMFAIYNTVK